MTENKRIVEKYMEGFNKSHHEQILSCLTDDIVWEMPGQFHLVGKDAFDKEIENDAFVGSPEITVTRMTEENNVVVVRKKFNLIPICSTRVTSLYPFQETHDPLPNTVPGGYTYLR